MNEGENSVFPIQVHSFELLLLLRRLLIFIVKAATGNAHAVPTWSITNNINGLKNDLKFIKFRKVGGRYLCTPVFVTTTS